MRLIDTVTTASAAKVNANETAAPTPATPDFPCYAVEVKSPHLPQPFILLSVPETRTEQMRQRLQMRRPDIPIVDRTEMALLAGLGKNSLIKAMRLKFALGGRLRNTPATNQTLPRPPRKRPVRIPNFLNNK